MTDFECSTIRSVNETRKVNAACCFSVLVWACGQVFFPSFCVPWPDLCSSPFSIQYAMRGLLGLVSPKSPKNSAQGFAEYEKGEKEHQQDEGGNKTSPLLEETVMEGLLDKEEEILAKEETEDDHEERNRTSKEAQDDEKANQPGFSVPDVVLPAQDIEEEIERRVEERLEETNRTSKEAQDDETASQPGFLVPEVVLPAQDIEEEIEKRVEERLEEVRLECEETVEQLSVDVRNLAIELSQCKEDFALEKERRKEFQRAHANAEKDVSALSKELRSTTIELKSAASRQRQVDEREAFLRGILGDLGISRVAQIRPLFQAQKEELTKAMKAIEQTRRELTWAKNAHKHLQEQYRVVEKDMHATRKARWEADAKRIKLEEEVERGSQDLARSKLFVSQLKSQIHHLSMNYHDEDELPILAMNYQHSPRPEEVPVSWKVEMKEPLSPRQRRPEPKTNFGGRKRKHLISKTR